MKPFRPMLAYSDELPPLAQLHYPLLCTPKIDGIRALLKDGQLVSRSLKPIPNQNTRCIIQALGLPNGWDGELVHPEGFNASQRAFMTQDGQPPFSWLVFDWYYDLPYKQRCDHLKRYDDEYVLPPYVQAWLPDLVKDEEELLEYEAECLKQGYEGVIMRAPYGPYKHGRSTLSEGYMMKLKRTVTDTCVIVGFVEQMHNTNPATLDERGYAKRSSAQEGKVPADTLGALVVEHPTFGQFEISNVGSDDIRNYIWATKASYLGMKVQFKYMKVGMLHKPRHARVVWQDPPNS